MLNIREFAPSDKLPTGGDRAIFRTRSAPAVICKSFLEHGSDLLDFVCEGGSIPTGANKKKKTPSKRWCFLLVNHLQAKSNL